MKSLMICVFALICTGSSTLRAEFRNWTNSEGKTVDAELIKVDGDNVTLRLRNGKTTPYSQAKLSEADRDYITKNPPADPTAKSGTTTPGKADANRKAKWLTKMTKAKEESKATGLPILVLFTGTTWCPYCIKLEKAVFSQKEFTTFANENLVLLKLDFGPGGRTDDKDHAKLQQEFGVGGFPTYFLTDAEGTKLAQGGYSGGIDPEKFASWVKSAKPKTQ